MKLIIVYIFILLTFPACYHRGGMIHRVQEGDSLTQIAHVYDVELQEILKANPRLDADQLILGQRVFIPGISALKRVPKSEWNFEDPPIEIEPEKKEPMKESPPIATQPSAKTEESLPSSSFIWPAHGRLISKFGFRNRKMHNGIDIRIAPEGEIRAVGKGKVVYEGSGISGYGRLVIIRHPNNLFSVSAYLGTILCKVGTMVEQGAVIAKANVESKGPFFHFEIRKGKAAIDPIKILPPF